MATRGGRSKAPRRRIPTALVVLVVCGTMVVGCGSSGSDGSAPPKAAPTSTAAVSYPSPGDDPRYEAWATVLQGRDDGPELCLGGITESLPPGCGGPPIPNWVWEAVPPSEHRSGVRWGEYHVQGTFDGKEFTLTAAPTDIDDDPRPPDSHRDRATTPCPAPTGGWVVVDPANVTDDGALRAAARAQPDYGGVWFDDLGVDDPNGHQDLSAGVFTFSFTGDLARHEAELRKLWGGPLCVTLAPVTKTALDAAGEQLLADQEGGKVDGLDVLGFGVNEMLGSLDLQVVWAPGGTEAAFTQRYGVPVHLAAALRPIA